MASEISELKMHEDMVNVRMIRVLMVYQYDAHSDYERLKTKNSYNFFQAISKRLTANSNHELSADFCVKRCDWHILVGN